MRILVLLAVVIFGAYNALAADAVVKDGMADKGTHGVVNALSGWTEIPLQTYKGYVRGIKLNPEKPALARSAGTVLGFGRGLNHAVGRTLLGVYQFVGFWAANPEDNHGVGVPLDGEYARDWGEAHGIPLKEQPKPMGKKLKRGVTNFAASPVEIPYQMRFGKRTRYRTGVRKGVWFGLSRLWTGTYEAITFPLPSALETEGYAFDQERPGRALHGNRGEYVEPHPWLKEGIHSSKDRDCCD
ncbi:MAG: hypothetical protein ACI8W8_000646 [Rhodothermales bacterium]|jgi:hypothetical protein